MKYKGFIIEHDIETDCRPPKKDEGIQWVSFERKLNTWQIINPMDNGKSWDGGFDSVSAAKIEIDRLLGVMGIPDNTAKTWKRLEK